MIIGVFRPMIHPGKEVSSRRSSATRRPRTRRDSYLSRPATFALFRRGAVYEDLIAAAGSESYLGIVRVRITRCHLACRPLILPALLSGVRSSSAARRPARSSGPGISQRSSGSGWLIAGRSWSRYVLIRRGWRHAWKSSAACSQSGYPCPEPLTGAVPFGDGVATAEAYVPGGALLPSAGRSAWAFAGAFARLVTLAPRPAEVPTLDPPPSWADWNHAGAGLWPHPEDPDVNLNEVAGPAWIDDTGRRARDRLRAGASEAVIGHCDWLAANLRWNRDKLLVVHDWDSVTADSEAVLAGFAAALYSTVSVNQLATVEETQRFLVAYRDAHGRELSADELELSWAAGVWTRAYDARYQHAVGQPVRSLTENAARERLHRAGIG